MISSAHHRHARVPPLRSLAFAGDGLVDWLGGWHIDAEGNATRFGTGHTYRFDAAHGLGDVGVIYERRGTKGIVVRSNGRAASPGWVPMGVDIEREIDRSFYQAQAYDFPVVLFTLPDGRGAIAHCPRDYNRLDIELLDGTLLTERTAEDDDIFHSRLQVSPDGRWLLSNGWVWHPWNIVQLYDVARALADPAHLAGAGVEIELGDDWEWEVEGATIVGDQLVVTSASESHALGVIALDAVNPPPRIHRLDASPGTTLVPWGPSAVACVVGTPRVIDLASGRVTERWPDLHAGPDRLQPGHHTQAPTPPWIAVDRIRERFAIARPGPDDPDGQWHLDWIERAR